MRSRRSDRPEPIEPPLEGPSLQVRQPLRLVLDTNVLVSALIQPLGPSGEVLRAWGAGDVELVLCPELLSELAEVLARPKLRSRVREDLADGFLRLLRSQAELRADPPFSLGLTADPRDDFVVALARATRADYVVSGDEHLSGVTEPPVLTPRAMLEVIRGHGR